MKYVFLVLIGVVMFSGATALHIYGPVLSEGEDAAVVLFGAGGVIAFLAGLAGLADEFLR